MRKSIELIVPCYNEQECIELFYKRIVEVFNKGRLADYDFIITFIDDGSKDDTMLEIKKVVDNATAGRIQYISLSRNFGKESALYAGLSKASGDYICVLDADLQHPPELIEDMIAAIEDEGYDCVSARRVARKGDSLFRRFFSKLFFSIINKITVMELVPGGTDYRLMKRKVAEAIVSLPETERFTKGIYSWIGFNNKWIEYKDVERVAGKTTWSFRGLVKYAMSGFVAFATTPLRGIIYFGSIITCLSIIFGIYTAVVAFNTPQAERTGYATIVLLIIFFSGIIITILGIIGEYMAKIYTEVKHRPIYLARETNIITTISDEHIKESGKKGN